MNEPGVEQIRSFRLHSHHLDADCSKENITEIAGACGLQNSPPGAWESALHNRVPACSPAEMEHLLYEEKSLLQAWSMRGAPVVFPAAESDVFLSALAAEADEPWIYTRGIGLALDFLEMSFEELFALFRSVMPRLDEVIIVSKSAFDETVAGWMRPLLPAKKQALWSRPSMYGTPDRQTVGGAVVSFMLRPAAYLGLAVFGRREGVSPSFTSYSRWTGHPLKVRENAAGELVRKFLHCYGPSTADGLINWLGCSGTQGRRLWASVSEELEPVTVLGKKAFLLSEDRKRLFSPASFERELLLLSGHDPFLDQRDRAVLQPDKTLQKQIWRTVANPGAIVRRGEIIGIWTGKKNGKGMDIRMTLWSGACDRQKLPDLAEEYAAFRGQKLTGVELQG